MKYPKRSPDGQESLIGEGNTLLRLRHPHVLKLFGVLPNSGALVLELMAGGNVDQWFGNSRLHWRKRGLPLMCQLSSALDYIHVSGFMHCDIKPQNVLVDAQLHTTKLADVGVARPINTASGQIQTTLIMLSPLFIAPEVNDGEYGFPADIFSFGMLLHVLMREQLMCWSSRYKVDDIVNVPERILSLIKSCICPARASDRLSAHSINCTLDELVNEHCNTSEELSQSMEQLSIDRQNIDAEAVCLLEETAFFPV